MSLFVDNCRFTPTAGGTTDWTFSAAVTGYQSPALANALNGSSYKFLAISADLTQWEMTQGNYNSGTGVFARTTVLYNSSGTGTAAGQSGAGTKINFIATPTVAIIAMAEDLRIGITIQTFASGSGTYTTPAGVLWLRVRGVGGGGGGGGSGTVGGGAGGAGGNTTFGTTLLVANGGTGGSGPAGTSGGAGGTASLGSGPIGMALQGGQGGGNTNNVGFTGGFAIGAPGGVNPFGGSSGTGPANTSGQAGVTNTGAGGGGAATSAVAGDNSGCGGGAGGYFDAIINAPLATYAYAVGAAGTAGAAGTSGFIAGPGGSGFLIVEEHYT